ncbi:MAG: hypothetical protein ABW169_08605 [Sphingobium sp.]
MTRLTQDIITTAAILLSLGASPAVAYWPDAPVARLEILAQLQTLNADLLSHDSATLTLDRWCARHHLGDNGKVVADRVRGESKDPPAAVRQQLQTDPDEPIAYRRVTLRCGAHEVSEADNWYVPSRLTPDMNDKLETTDTPFGRVVQPLGFQRHTVSAKLLWSPLPEDWDTGVPLPPRAKPHGRLSIPDKLIEHQALLTRADGKPFSYVIETYGSAVLDFPPSFTASEGSRAGPCQSGSACPAN